MTKEVSKKQETGLSKEAADLSAWGAPEGLSQQDIIIPKILPMQLTSPAVKEGKAVFGEFRDSVSNVKYGSVDETFEVIPFKLERAWVETKIVKGKRTDFLRRYLINADNDDLPIAGSGQDREGESCAIERDRCLDFYVLLPEEVKTGRALPRVISFRRTSSRGGKKLATTMFVTNTNAGKVPAARAVAISGKKVDGDKGTYMVMDVTETRDSTAEEINMAFSWLKRIKAGEAKVDESDLKAATSEETQEVPSKF